VHHVGLIVLIYYDARSTKHETNIGITVQTSEVLQTGSVYRLSSVSGVCSREIILYTNSQLSCTGDVSFISNFKDSV
jgi:hypothetical protein